MIRLSSGDVSGAVADLGVLVPLAAGLVLVNGMQPGPLLIGAGALAIAAGVYFGIPFPVQPLKAVSALAIAQSLAPGVITAAGLEIGVLFIILSVTGLAERLARIFTRYVIRSLQLGVGVLLIVTAVRLALEPPAVLGLTVGRAWVVPLTAVVAVTVAVAGRYDWRPAGALILAASVAAGSILAAPDVGPIQIALPSVGLPPWSAFGTAFVLLVIPQVPLTYGNAVVGVSDLAREIFGVRAKKVTARAVALSCGLANVASAVIGGIPMCHGSSGLSAHVRLGARTRAMNVILGTVLVMLGLVYSQHVIALFGVLPVWVLAGFLAYAGIRHALLVLDLRGRQLALATAAGAIGVVTGNLAYTTAFALATRWFSVASMSDREQERDDSVPEEVPAKTPTDEDPDEKKKKKDEDDDVADHASEQSMDASDPPAW